MQTRKDKLVSQLVPHMNNQAIFFRSNLTVTTVAVHIESGVVEDVSIIEGEDEDVQRRKRCDKNNLFQMR